MPTAALLRGLLQRCYDSATDETCVTQRVITNAASCKYSSTARVGSGPERTSRNCERQREHHIHHGILSAAGSPPPKMLRHSNPLTHDDPISTMASRNRKDTVLPKRAIRQPGNKALIAQLRPNTVLHGVCHEYECLGTELQASQWHSGCTWHKPLPIRNATLWIRAHSFARASPSASPAHLEPAISYRPAT